MMECQTLPEYGMVFYQVATSKKDKMGSVWLGLSVRGIVMYCVHKEVKTPFMHWPWSELKNLSYTVSCYHTLPNSHLWLLIWQDKKFFIEEDSGKTNTFYTESHQMWEKHVLSNWQLKLMLCILELATSCTSAYTTIAFSCSPRVPQVLGM